jgi:membrane fusion protein (multidrug efflux system)
MPSKKIISIALLAALAGSAYFAFSYGKEETDAATIEAHVSPIASKISGYVTSVNIKDNQLVHQGDVLLELEVTDYKASLDLAQANVLAAKARLSAAENQFSSTQISAPSSLESAKSQVASAKAELDRAGKELARQHSMNETARSKQSLDNAVAAEKSARSAWLDAQARLKSAQTAPNTIASARASVEELQADVLRAQAELALAQRNMDATKIRAPYTGRIAKRTVELGAYIQPAQQLMTLVSEELWVVANYKETQLEAIQRGQSVAIHVDAYPHLALTGKVDSIQAGTGSRFSLFPPENATGNFVKIVQRVPVKIILDNQPPKEITLGAGMSVIATINTHTPSQ